MKRQWLLCVLVFVLMLSLVACAQQQGQTASKLTKEELAMEIDFPNVPESLAAKMEIDIYLLAGQSNAAGSTSLESAKEGERDENTYKNVRYYTVETWTDGKDYGADRTYSAVREGLGIDGEHIGPELGMARALNDRYATNEKKAVIVKVAAGGTMLLANETDGQRSYADVTWEIFERRGSWYPQALESGGNVDPYRPTGLLTRSLCQAAKEVYDDLRTRGFTAENIHFKALCWMQGENDRNNGRKYVEVFPLFATELRSYLSEATGADYSAMPIVIGEISETFSSASPGSIQTNQKFIKSQHKLAENDPAITVIPTGQYQLNEIVGGVNTPLGTDTFHWNYADMLQIGEMFGNTAYDVSHPAA